MNYFEESDDELDDEEEEDNTKTQETDPGEKNYKDPLIGEGSGEEDVQVL